MLCRVGNATYNLNFFNKIQSLKDRNIMIYLAIKPEKLEHKDLKYLKKMYVLDI